MKKMAVLSWVVICAVALFLAGPVRGQDFQRDLEGTVGKARVQMELTKIGQSLEGSYYYEKYGTPIKVKGQMIKSKVRLKEEKGAIFEGDLANDGSFQGTWASRDKKRSLPVTLKVALDTVAFTIYSKDWTRQGKSKLIEKCEFERLYLHPTGYGDNKNLEKIRGTVWKIFFGDRNLAAAKGDPRKAIDLESKEFRAECLQAEKDGAGSDHMETTKKMSTVFNQDSILTIKNESWEYMGGTRGTPDTSYTVINLEKGAALLLKDIFKDGYDTYLGTIVTKKLKEELAQIDKKAKSLKDAGYTKFKENSLNDPYFYITSDGIGFFYNAYALGPAGPLGAVSETDIFVPFKEIEKERLRPESVVYKLAYGKK